MPNQYLIKHAPGAPGLRNFGLGPNLFPAKGLLKLQLLLNKYTFWASKRSRSELKTMLKNSSVVVSVWEDNDLIGFGRATSDGIFRSVIWDVVVANNVQGNGYGRRIINEIINSPMIKKSEKIYLMTTHRSEFYKQLGFQVNSSQKLMIFELN
jgi:N-acetylglutamate synthase-like GNAT family acetyltransferase